MTWLMLLNHWLYRNEEASSSVIPLAPEFKGWNELILNCIWFLLCKDETKLLYVIKSLCSMSATKTQMILWDINQQYAWPAFPYGLFYQHGLSLIPALTSNHIHYNVWDEITYPFPNFNGTTVEVWEWISNFIPYFIEYVISYPCWD